jgi:hypothetical protein
MENTALILIIITLFLLVVILGILSFMIVKLLKDRSQQTNSSNNPAAKNDYHPEILARMKEAEVLRSKKSDLFCPNHSEEPGETVCAVCDKLFCRSCIKPFKSMHLCKEHLPLLMRHDWAEVLTLKTSTHDPEGGVRLYEQKKKIFEKYQIATYIETHYKINVDDDFIETFLVLFSIREEVEKAREKFEEVLR